MNDISDLTGKGLPSSIALVKASAVALLLAAVVLALIVLPAEYGIDPTGIGQRLGLAAMSDADESEDAQEAAPVQLVDETRVTEPVSVLDAVWERDTEFRTDEMSITLKPNEGGEIKALMAAGDRMMFSWKTDGGGVNFDMHGEALNAAKDEFTSYWKGRDQATAHGAFEAPFAGTHGWYWRNRGSVPVTVRVKTSGYYEKLFEP